MRFYFWLYPMRSSQHKLLGITMQMSKHSRSLGDVRSKTMSIPNLVCIGVSTKLQKAQDFCFTSVTRELHLEVSEEQESCRTRRVANRLFFRIDIIHCPLPNYK